MSRDEGRDSQLELLKVNDFVDGVVGVVWLMGNVWIVWPFKSGVLGGGIGIWLGSIDGLAFVSKGLVIFWYLRLCQQFHIPLLGYRI